MVNALGVWIAAYCIGAIPFGYLVARARGVDIFAHGSGNIGATNVGRVLGRRFGALVFVLDFLKGAVPVLLALWLKDALPSEPAWLHAGWLEVGAGLAAFLGHVFPVYLNFRGGKGVATGAGVAFALVPAAAAGALMVWVLFLLATRCVSLSSLAAAFTLILLQIAAAGGLDLSDPRTVFCLAAGALVVVRHRGNIVRLREGTEPRVPSHPALLTLGKTLHVLALGLWFGSAVFFTLAASVLFDSFEALSKKPATERPAWFPLAEPFDKVTPEIDGPREQGSRAFGFAVGPQFVWYFLLQGVCGCIAFGTAWPWRDVEPGSRVHSWRAYLLLAAVATVVIGWRLEQKVYELRGPRNEATEAYLRADAASAPTRLTEMQAARAAFGMWHGVSLLFNFATLVLVGTSLALAARLPVQDEC